MFKKPKLLPPIRTYEEDYIWEADLMFFTHPAIAKENDGYLYILAIIDTFTKMVMLKKLKNKSTKTITEDVNRLFQREKPKYLRVDMGGEFISNMFVNMCKKNKVKLYIAMEPIKCAMVERFIRTFKRILVQKMEKEHTLRWSDFVGDCKNIYDNRTHRTIKMTPLKWPFYANIYRIHSYLTNVVIYFICTFNHLQAKYLEHQLEVPID